MVNLGPLDPQGYPDVQAIQDTQRQVLGLAPKYADKKAAPGGEHNYDFNDWWEQYVTEPIAAANPTPEPKTIPLTANMPPMQDKYDWGSSDMFDDNDVNMWRVFAYIIMAGLCMVVALYAVAALLAVIFLAMVVGVAWLGLKR